MLVVAMLLVGVLCLAAWFTDWGLFWEGVLVELCSFALVIFVLFCVFTLLSWL